MIRPFTEDDADILTRITADTGTFKPQELDALADEVFPEYFDYGVELGHQCEVLDENGPVGFVYYTPVSLTVGTWDIWWIVVQKNSQGRGYGKRLLRHAEQQITAAGGRILFISTSSLPEYKQAHRFYEGLGYHLNGTLHDYYSP